MAAQPQMDALVARLREVLEREGAADAWTEADEVMFAEKTRVGVAPFARGIVRLLGQFNVLGRPAEGPELRRGQSVGCRRLRRHRPIRRCRRVSS